MDDALFPAAFLAAEGLPESLRAVMERLWRPLAQHILAQRAARGGMLVVGLCGPQGSGKSTVALALERLLVASGVRCARLSLDDLYLSHAARRDLAREVHPLLATRGPPGTHDPALGVEVLEALARPSEVRLPRFDKAHDDRADPADWPVMQGPVEIVIFEGWCIGARPQPPEALAQPVNALEAEEDTDGTWRRYVNAALATHYPPLFDRIDLLVLLRAPGFDSVLGWRREQEHKLRARVGKGAGLMSDTEVARFIQLYERLTRWIDAEMPTRADVVIQLGQDRAPVSVSGV